MAPANQVPLNTGGGISGGLTNILSNKRMLILLVSGVLVVAFIGIILVTILGGDSIDNVVKSDDGSLSIEKTIDPQETIASQNIQVSLNE